MDHDPPRLHAAMMQRFDEIVDVDGPQFERLFQRFQAAIGDPCAPSRLRAARDLCDCLTILDVGCGLGTFFQTLLHHATPTPEHWRYVGIDQSQNMLDIAFLGTSGREQGRLCTADIDQPHPDQFDHLRAFGPYDGVLVRHVLEHLFDPRRALRNVLGLAAKRVVLIFSQAPTANVFRVLTDTDMGVTRWAHPEHVLREWIAREGFTITLADSYRPGCETLSPREGYWLLERSG